MMSPKYLPLRYESCGDQWWFASPIDLAAANGHYDLVKHLLYIEPDLLIKLTSLQRIRRLESLWDDEESFNAVSKCRSFIARKLLQEYETKKGHNSLIRAGYGGWLLYTATSAGDLTFVKDLLDRDPLLVFGEGEYRVIDMFYAVARSKSCDVFRLLLDSCLSQKGVVEGEVSSVFRGEVMNRVVHAVARSGNLEMLKELLGDGCDVLAYRDSEGYTVLHSASGRGHVEVVKDLISSYKIINLTDNQGNTALNIAAHRGHLHVMEVLISSSPSLALIRNNYGDTFLHMAVSGFRSPSFKQKDRQIELMRQLVSGKLLNVEEMINVQNNEGRTPLHVAISENIQSDIVEILISTLYIDLSIRDFDGNTPLDLLKQNPQSPNSEILIRRMVMYGGFFDRRELSARRNAVSILRTPGIGSSPGTSFKIPDEEIFSCFETEDVCSSSLDLSRTESEFSCEIGRMNPSSESNSSKYKKLGSMNRATRHLKTLLSWSSRRGSEAYLEENRSLESYNYRNDRVPLRHQFSRLSSLSNNKRVTSFSGDIPSPSAKKKFEERLAHGVLPMSYIGSPSIRVSESSSQTDERVHHQGIVEKLKMKRKNASFDLRMMNNYFCFGAQGLAVENSLKALQKSQNHQQKLVLS